MSNVTRSRVAAVRILEQLGYRWDGGVWAAPTGSAVMGVPPDFLQAADDMHTELLGQVGDLAGAPDNPDTAETLERLGALIDAYESSRPLE